MTTLLALLLATIFIILSSIHMNWVFGGKWAFEKSLPQKPDGKIVYVPSKSDCAIVAGGLLICGLFYLANSSLFAYELPMWMSKLGTWIIPILFVGRAIGDFKYVGFFKKIRATEFAIIDSRLFTPLCLIIGLIGFSILILNFQV